MEKIRLQKFLANSGVCSRRSAEKLILDGKITVNGAVITVLGTTVDPERDVVAYNGKEVKLKAEKVYVLLNKPIGYVTTVKEQFGRPTVMDLVKGVKCNLLPVGRLDMYTSGAIILTNDGDFIYTVTHPKNEVEKTYNATVRGIVNSEDVKALENGVKIEDYISGKAKVKILKVDLQKNISRIQITIHEGKNREVRKMCSAIGKSVLALHRCKIGNIDVKDLKVGTWRYLKEVEVAGILKKLACNL
ncbi:MAG: rRNA pseudouridine synthase [Clostridia bacterium]|nr:rRNA pseudouridine synthase [Clostridia bacterium]